MTEAKNISCAKFNDLTKELCRLVSLIETDREKNSCYSTRLNNQIAQL
jgi:hypothetical protein